MSVPVPHSPAQWVGVVLGAAAVLLVPWAVFLGASLPDRQLSANYALAWSGFDALLVAALATTSYAVLRRRAWVGMAAGATAALLVTDAWFDVVTAPHRTQLVEAALSAALVELPLAAVCVWVCGRADRRLQAVIDRDRASRRRS